MVSGIEPTCKGFPVLPVLVSLKSTAPVALDIHKEPLEDKQKVKKSKVFASKA